MQICFFEGPNYKNFHPLTLTRPVDDLRVGILTMREKWTYTLNKPRWGRLLRPHFNGCFEKGALGTEEPCLWINGSYFPSEGLLDKIDDLEPGSCLRTGDTVVAALVEGKTSKEWFKNENPAFNTLLVLDGPGFKRLENLWDLFLFNGEQIELDLGLLGYPSSSNKKVPGHLMTDDPDRIFIEEGVSIEPGCTFITEDGPIYIGKGAKILAGSLVRGPAAICEDALLKMGAKIYKDTTIGPVCKVGGEINNCIFHSYSNKGHDGFLGNSLIGQWCNLGADTNTSNLKNNYSPVRITEWVSGTERETGQQFVGTIMGDHTKTAINTQLNTGTVCGVSCNIFSSDFPPKFIPSFSWVGTNVIQPYRFDKALETMEAMMQRRDVELTTEYQALMKHIFDHSREV